MREERKEEVMVIRKEVEEKVGELTKKLEFHERKVAEVEVKATRDLPYVMMCAYKAVWSTPDSTITYDRLTADYNNGNRPGGGDSTMDINTGKFTTLTPGHYTVTYSGRVYVNPSCVDPASDI